MDCKCYFVILGTRKKDIALLCWKVSSEKGNPIPQDTLAQMRATYKGIEVDPTLQPHHTELFSMFHVARGKILYAIICEVQQLIFLQYLVQHPWYYRTDLFIVPRTIHETLLLWDCFISVKWYNYRSKNHNISDFNSHYAKLCKIIFSYLIPRLNRLHNLGKISASSAMRPSKSVVSSTWNTYNKKFLMWKPTRMVLCKLRGHLLVFIK